MVSAAPAIIVMGVAGSGKSLLGRLLAARCGWVFIEGDDHHPPRNRQKLARAIPLTDADRREWLDAIAAELARGPLESPVILACSALKRAYRDRLREAGRPLVLLHLTADATLLKRRLDTRQGHFVSSALLPSQLDDLEPPGADEVAATLDASQTPDRLLDSAIAALRSLAPNAIC
jgi:gluconokinase